MGIAVYLLLLKLYDLINPKKQEMYNEAVQINPSKLKHVPDEF